MVVAGEWVERLGEPGEGQGLIWAGPIRIVSVLFLGILGQGPLLSTAGRGLLAHRAGERSSSKEESPRDEALHGAVMQPDVSPGFSA